MAAILAAAAIIAVILPTKNAAAETVKAAIRAEFDTTAGTVHGEALITLPAGVRRDIFLSGLDVEKILINGREPGQGNNAIHRKRDRVLNLPVSEQRREIRITWTHSAAKDELVTPGQIYLHGPWHPDPGGPAVFSLTARLPAGFHAVSQAETITEREENGGVVAAFSFPHPLRRLVLVAGPWTVRKKTLKDGPDIYALFFPEDEELVDEYLERAAAYVRRYQELVGPFPYRRFSIVENRLPTGFAVPTFTLLGQMVARLPFITSTSLGHEILHQWFGNAVEVAAESSNWCEGLATYLADQSFAADAGRGAEFRKGQLLAIESYVHKDNAISLAEFTGGVSHLTAGSEARRAVGYGRASMFFHMLAKRIGREAFTKGLRLLYERFRYRSAGWGDVEAAMEEASGKKLADFFTSWLTTREDPAIAARGLNVTEKDGIITLRFDIEQKGEKISILNVPVRVVTPSGTVDKTIEAGKKTGVKIELDDYPEAVILDPEYDLARRLEASEIPPVWSRVRGAEKRLFILKDEETQEKFADFLAAVRKDGDETVLDSEVDDRQLEAADIVFVDATGGRARAMFATGAEAEADGFRLEVRKNPLAPARTATLVCASSKAEVAAAVRKLRHYGKYSLLEFAMGRITKKEITPSASGIRYLVNPEPSGFARRPRLSFTEVMKRIADRRVVYVGESHTSAADHHLQIRVVRAMYRQDPDKKLAIGMEMFSRDQQEVLDRYVLKKELDEPSFLREAKYFKRWGYDYRFYRPILDFARKNAIPVIALNQPKTTVSKVYHSGGLLALSDEELAGLPPDRDLTLPGYRERLNRVFRMHRKGGRLNDFLQAQAIWDETMAETAADYLERRPESRMVILAGRGHVEPDAIPPRVKRRLGAKQAVLLNRARGWDAAAAADFLMDTAARALPPLPLMGVVLKEEKEGVRIVAVREKSPADRAGVKKNDLILEVDGEKVADINDIKVVMLYKKKGDSIRLFLQRDHLLWPTTTGLIEVKL